VDVEGPCPAATCFEKGGLTGAILSAGNWKKRKRELIVKGKKNMSSLEQATGASRLIDQRIQDLGDWRGETLSRMRQLIKKADPEVVEEWKWMGTPVWSHDGIICTGESYKNVVKLTFAKGAFLNDPARLFNSSLDGNVRRAIDLHEGEEIDESALKALVREAIALNSAGKSKSSKKAKSRGARP
jgi:hypothetical protein